MSPIVDIGGGLREGEPGKPSSSFLTNSFSFHVVDLEEALWDTLKAAICTVLKLQHASESSARLVRTQMTGLHQRLIQKAWCEAWECEFLTHFLGDADGPGPATTFWEPLSYLISLTHLLKIMKTRITCILFLCNWFEILSIFIILAF